jgi:hypothetical protein
VATKNIRAGMTIVVRSADNFNHALQYVSQFSTRTLSFVLDSKPLKTKRRQLYLKTQSVPRCKHFSSRLYKPISLCCKWHKSLFVLR